MRISIILIVLSFISCKNSPTEKIAGAKYIPSAKNLKKGVVWKYYYHRGKHNTQHKTDILYRKFVLQNNILHTEDYNAGFQKVHTSDIKCGSDKWLVLNEKALDYRNIHVNKYEERAYTLGQNVHTDWVENSAVLEKLMLENENGTKTINRQTSIRDTVIDGQASKVIEGNRTFIPIRNNANQDSTHLTWQKLFLGNTGMVWSEMRSDEHFYRLELDELISVAEFEKRANHGTHRVGYIDTLQTLDDHTQFAPCFHIDKINDYYNDRRSMIKGGKGRLRALLQEKLDPKKIQGESGFLTYRFVINCKGQTGWYVTEEADLSYAKIRFSEACRQHLYDLLQSENDWINLQIGEMDRDAYTYITFKLKDGEIIEILP